MAIEVCDTGADYRLDGRIVVAKNADHPAFAQAALDDRGDIASISDPTAHVGFDFLIQLLETLKQAERRLVTVRSTFAGAVRPANSQTDKFRPFTRPGTTDDSPTSAEWQAATSQGLDVYSNDGTPVGGAGQYFKGLSKGTGSGIGAIVFYQPENLPDPKSCSGGQTSDVALLHELLHAAHMVQGSVDNTPYSNGWWSQDPLAARYGVHEEKFVVERENEYRTALRQKYPSCYRPCSHGRATSGTADRRSRGGRATEGLHEHETEIRADPAQPWRRHRRDDRSRNARDVGMGGWRGLGFGVGRRLDLRQAASRCDRAARRARGPHQAVCGPACFASTPLRDALILAYQWCCLDLMSYGRTIFVACKARPDQPGEWFAEQFAERVGAEKTMVQKSGYFSRSAAANEADRTLIRQMVEVAVEAAQQGVAGVVGQDEERDDELRTIEFDRIAGGKAFDTSVDWFQSVLKRTGQV